MTKWYFFKIVRYFFMSQTMIIRTKLISFEVKNIDLSDLYDLYQKEDNTVSEKLSDGQMVELITTSTGATSLIIHGKAGDVTEIKLIGEKDNNK